MKFISLSQGKFAKVDDEDYTRLSQFSWYVYKGYAARSYVVDGKRRHRLMHCEILKIEDGKERDHWDRDKLNNQKENLRVCTHAQNSRNQGKRSHNTSGYKGVGWHKASKKWRADIGVDGKFISLGLFEDIVKAAEAYDEAAKKFHGSFAVLNFGEKNGN